MAEKRRRRQGRREPESAKSDGTADNPPYSELSAAVGTVGVERSGGFAGTTRSGVLLVADLPDHVRSQLDAVLTQKTPPTPTSSRGADRFVYTFTVEGGVAKHTTTIAESELEADLREAVRKALA
jgi:hypothetical protein